MDDLLTQYERYLKGRGFAEGTQRAYLFHVKKFLQQTAKPILDITIKDCINFQMGLIDRKLNPHTVNVYTSAVRLFFLQTVKRKWPVNFIPLMKRRRKIPIVLSPEEVADIINSAKNLKHKTVLITMYATGLRVGEVAKIKPSDIDSKRMVINVLGKGDKNRMAILSQSLLEALRYYWVTWKENKKIWLFPSVNDPKNHFSTTTIRRVFRQARDQAGVKKRVGSHVLRHCFATHCLEMGVDLRLIQLLLGHAVISSTTIYTHLRNDQFRQIKNPLDSIADQIKKQK